MGYNDRRLNFSRARRPYDVGYGNETRRNPAIQIINGLDGMQENIKNIRLMRQKKDVMDRAFEIKKKQDALTLDGLEMQLGPEATAFKRENLNLAVKKQKIDSAIQDRQLQRAQMSEEENFARGVDFVRKLNKTSQDSGEDLFGMQASIDKAGNYILAPRKGVMDMAQRNDIAIKEMARKMATSQDDGFDEKKYDEYLVKLKGAQPAPSGPPAWIPKGKEDQYKAAIEAGYTDDDIKKYLGA